MKKIILTMTLIAAVAAGALTLSAFTKSETKTDTNPTTALEGLEGGSCLFKVTKTTPTLNGNNATATIAVRIEPAFKPSDREKHRYKVIVSPTGILKDIFYTSTQSIEFVHYGTSWNAVSQDVYFNCSVEDNSYRQCKSGQFSVECYEM